MSEEVQLKKGYYVLIDYSGAPPDNYHEIIAAEALEFETGEEETAIFSDYAAGAESGYKNIELLEPDDVPPHLYYVLWGVKDTLMKYYMKLPTGTNRFGVDEDKDVGFITAERSPYFAPNPRYGFWLLHAWYPSVNVKNESPITRRPKIWFTGTKYDIKKVTDPELLEALKTGKVPSSKITLGGIKTAS